MLPPVLYERYNTRWFILVEDYRIPLTLTEIYVGRPDLLKIMCDKTGVSPDEPLEIVAPKGFVTDLASFPALFHSIGLTPTGPWEEAAAIHDLLYQKTTTTVMYPDEPLSLLTLHTNKDFADRLFLVLLRKGGVGMVLRKAMHEAVVQYGWGAYVDPNAGELYAIPPNMTFNPQRNYLFFRKPGEAAIEPLGKDPTLANVKFPNIKRAFLNVTI